MILYGRDLSPFTRRVAIWCGLQGRDLERRQLSVAGEDMEKIRAVNPIARVPVLTLADGTRLMESFTICDWLDETAPDRRLVPASGTARRDCLQHIALAHSVAEKSVAMVYEKNRRPQEFQWPDWQDRLAGQVRGGLGEMEATAPADGWLGGAEPDGSDIAFAVTHDFIEVTNPWLMNPACPRLAAHAARANALPAIGASKPRP